MLPTHSLTGIQLESGLSGLPSAVSTTSTARAYTWQILAILLCKFLVGVVIETFMSTSALPRPHHVIPKGRELYRP